MEAYAGRAAMEIQARKWHKQGKKTALFKIMKKKGKPRLASGVDKAPKTTRWRTSSLIVRWGTERHRQRREPHGRSGRHHWWWLGIRPDSYRR